jgi:hypothetical protein
MMRSVFAALLAAVMLCACSARCDSDTITTAPPNVVFVPIPRAISSIKHPTLPVLYVTMEGSPESRNLFTFRLNADGTIDPNSKHQCVDYFSVDGKTPSFPHTVKRPTFNVDKSVLYLAAYPITANSVTTYGNSNNFEYAAVALDEQGQPAKRLKLFRTDQSGQQGLMGIRYEPTLRRLFFNYYSSTQWTDLDKDGLPMSINPTKWFNAGINFWSWIYVPEWRRFYQTRAAAHMAIVLVTPDNLQIEFIQYTNPQQGPALYGHIEVSTRFRKIYLLDSDPKRELIVFQLTSDGRLTNVPRYFTLGPTLFVRCDFKAGLLYALSKGEIRVFKLDANGYPSGLPQVHAFEHGDVWDVYMEESTGKLYVCTTKEMK